MLRNESSLKGVLGIVKQNRARTQARLEHERSSTSSIVHERTTIVRERTTASAGETKRSRSTSEELKSGIAYLADDVSELRLGFEQLQDEVRQLQAKQPLPQVGVTSYTLMLEQLSELEKEVKELKLERQQLKHKDLEPEKQVENGTSLEPIKDPVETETGLEPIKIIDPRSVGSVQEPSLNIKAIYDATQLREHSYMLHESMWDVVIFIGLPITGTWTSIDLSVTLLICLFVQVTLCVICELEVVMYDQSSLLGLNEWRWNSAHLASNTEEIWPFSLASRICEGDGSLQISAQQQLSFENAQGYRHPGAEYVGGLMATLCLLCFWASLWGEGRKALKCARGLLHLCGTHTRLSWEEDLFEFKSISFMRCAFVGVLLLLRVAVAVGVGFVGSQWIAHTTSVGAIFLNALALDMITSADEMFFEGLAPMAAKVLLQNCKPLPFSYVQWWMGITDCNAIVGKIFLAVGLTLAHIYMVEPVGTVVSQAHELICGGVTNFVFAEDVLGIIYVHNDMPTLAESDVPSKVAHDLRVLAIDEVKSGTPKGAWQYALHEPDLATLKAKSLDPLILAGNWMNPACEDLIVPEAPQNKLLPYQNRLRRVTNNMSLDMCLSAQPYCYGISSSAAFMRTICPVTCGCTSFNAGSFLTGSFALNSGNAGCPSTCVASMVLDVQKLTTCKDSNLNGTVLWQNWMQEATYVLNYPDVSSLTDHGCAGLQQNSTSQLANLCTNKWGAKVLYTLCPESCLCKEHPSEQWCPRVCQEHDHNITQR